MLVKSWSEQFGRVVEFNLSDDEPIIAWRSRANLPSGVCRTQEAMAIIDGAVYVSSRDIGDDEEHKFLSIWTGGGWRSVCDAGEQLPKWAADIYSRLWVMAEEYHVKVDIDVHDTLAWY